MKVVRYILRGDKSKSVFYLILLITISLSLPLAFAEVIKAERSGPAEEEIVLGAARSEASANRYKNISSAIMRGKKRGVEVADLEKEKEIVRAQIINGEYAEAGSTIAAMDSALLERVKKQEESERLVREEEERRRSAEEEARRKAEEEARQRGTIRGKIALNSKTVVGGKVELYSGDEKIADTQADQEGNYSINVKGGEYRAAVGSSSGIILFHKKVEISAGQENILDITYDAPEAPPVLQPAQKRIYATYERKNIQSSRGDFLVDLMTFDLASGHIKVATDTAESEECANNCPALSLGEFVRQNNAFAGMTGSYFCPPDYESCKDSINYFFWKTYNSRLGKMLNENNGLGENDHFLAFDSEGHPKYFASWNEFKSSDFPIYAGMNSKPALVENGQNILNIDSLDDKQRNQKIKWGALGLKGETLYAVVGSNVTVVDMAAVMTSLAVDNAMTLDGGGTTALIFDHEYKLGPGRNMPNAIVFVEK